jgi:1-acyl-sn-glycerol-3-phosphate acyltransferase
MPERVLFTAGRIIILLYARLMLQLDISWQAPLPLGPKLFVANHPSTTDPFYLALLLSQLTSLLIIEDAFLVPILGTYLRCCGHIPVAPGQGRRAFDAAHRLLASGRSVALFPEGDVSPQLGGYHPPRTGAARLALLTGVPVIPVGIYLPRERNHAVQHHIAGRHTVGYWYARGAYSLTVGPATYFRGDVEDRAGVMAASQRIMRQIISLADESERRTQKRLASPSPPLAVTLPRLFARFCGQVVALPSRDDL